MRDEERGEDERVGKVHASGRSLFLLAAFIGGLSVQKKKEKKARVAKRAVA